MPSRDSRHLSSCCPHAAYAAFTHGLFSRWSYLMCAIPDIKDFLQPLGDVIHQSFIPALFGRPPAPSQI